MRKLLLSLAVICGGLTLQAQDYFPKNDGVKTTNDNYTVFQNATIHTTPSTVIKKGTLIIRKGKIVQVGTSLKIPYNSVVIDLKGKHIYASFIDPFTSFGIKKPKAQGGNIFSSNEQPQWKAGREGYYWNDHIRPEVSALTDFKYDDKKATEYVKEGFGVLNTHMPDGIIRGTGALVALNNKSSEGERLLSDRSAQFLSFAKSNKSKQVYPTSLMGAMALLRQVYLDSKWYASGNTDNKDLTLEALNRNKGLPQIFEAGSRLNGFRADKVGDESGIQYIIVGGGDEYARINKVKATNAKYIIPLDFPEAYDVSDPYLANMVSLGDMRHWNQAPTNPSVLAKNGITFSFTTHKLKKISDLKSRIEKAIEHGLNKKTALAALTTIPAQILGKSSLLGSIKKGAYANFLITKGELFTKDNIIYENWIQGHKNVVNNMNITDINGSYELTVAEKTYNLSISGTSAKPKAKVKSGETTLGTKINYKDDWVTLTFTSEDSTKIEYTRVVTAIGDSPDLWNGKAVLPNGVETTFTVKKKPKETKKDDKKKKSNKKEKPEVLPITYPNIAYGNPKVPTSKVTLFKNATVWTNESKGILEQTDVLVKNGKIAAIGKNLRARGAIVVDATGKHLTAGIIDEHSHIAAAAINEAGHNSSAEVTIEDVVSPDDINIYRNLAGGVTSIQILHGSANPIGGRSAIIKLKWGKSAEDLIYRNSPKFIKFALGENVKQSNWGSNANNRFPQTRMGVEQVYTDYFSRAKKYGQNKKSGKYRKDIEMETLLEVLNGRRYISCHSYVQSEINMLMKVAEKFNFRINTFTHILEGYKVADKMAKHGVGGSTFSDWWAYKYEVNDAIPYNASIMHNQGVVTAINSDDPEMSRRLNQEAAKSVKYGGVSEEDALKFVTLNPAKLLHIDKRVGSIKVGKDADLVLWTDHPLSIYAKAEKTMIEGVTYFDLNIDKMMRESIAEERNKLSTMMLKAKNNGLKTQPPKKKEKQNFECQTIETIH